MPRSISIIVLISYTIGLLGPVLPIMDYMLRYDYYANVLCENRDKPELKCNGTCKLAQLMKASEEAKQASHEGQGTIEAPMMLFIHLENKSTEVPEDSSLIQSPSWLCRQDRIKDQWITSPLVPPPWA